MRIGLAPLAAAASVTGLMSVGAAVAMHQPVHHIADHVLAGPAAAAYFHDVQPTPAARPVARHHDEVVRPPVAPPSCPGVPTVHFDTPDQAMRYLATAWNRNDLAALCQVTNPNARFLLNQMHAEAVNLRLKSCQRLGVGQYSCHFIHDYPARMHRSGLGHAWLDVEAADNPGWYMTVLEGCG